MFDTKRYFDDCVRAIQESVRFDSSQAAPLPGMPFGKGAAEALGHFLALAERLGFAVKNYDNYIGEAVFGSGPDLAVLCHLDVVPAGEGWTHPPFAGAIEGGRLYGRGTMDDKGPAIVCLYCLKALKDAGFAPRRTIKLIVGCNEENGWECIGHYNRCARMPAEGFSPDADFPVIYAEKGILHFSMRFPFADAPFTALEAGERPNMVCSRAVARCPHFDEEAAARCGVRREGDDLVAEGRSAHASTPEEGENALEKLLRCFAAEDERAARICALLFDDVFGLKQMKDETGSLTMSPNVAGYDGKELTIVTDIRYPATFTQEQVTAVLDKFGAPYTLLHCQAPLYNDRGNFLIATLQKVYERHTGEKGEPVAIGGGTYARALQNGAAFGPLFPGATSTIHQADEYISLADVQMLLDIYCDALYELTK